MRRRDCIAHAAGILDGASSRLLCAASVSESSAWVSRIAKLDAEIVIEDSLRQPDYHPTAHRATDEVIYQLILATAASSCRNQAAYRSSLTSGSHAISLDSPVALRLVRHG